MPTRPFSDDRPLHWDLKGGRHNSLSRHRGMNGLWYLVGTWGQGRYQDGWSIMVFPDSVRVSGYAGRSTSRVLTEALTSNALLSIEGKGGYDYGKSAMSKGGYRAGGSIAYRYEDKDFDPALLRDGDEFLRQVLGFDPTPHGIKDGLARKAQEAADKKAAEEARMQAWRDQRQAEEVARAEAKAGFEGLFVGVEIPERFHHEVSSDGLKVWREYTQSFFGSNRYDQATHKTLEAYQVWLRETKVKLQKEAEEAQRRAVVHAQEEAKRQADENQKAAEEAAIEDHLDELDDLLSNL